MTKTEIIKYLKIHYQQNSHSYSDYLMIMGAFTYPGPEPITFPHKDNIDPVFFQGIVDDYIFGF